MATPELALLQGGYSTIPHKNVREYLKMLAVYGPGAGALGGGAAAARVTIQNTLEVHFSENGVTWTGYNGLTNYHKMIYADIARLGLVEARSDAATVAFPHADLVTDYVQAVITGGGPLTKPRMQALRFFNEMQNQAARGGTIATIRTFLEGLGLPSTAKRVLESDPQLAELATAAARLYHDNNWNGTNDPSNSAMRLTVANIRAYLRSKQYIDDITMRSWVAESEDIFTGTLFNETLEKIHGDVTGGGELAWNQLARGWLRHVSTASQEALQWAAFMIGHGYVPAFGMRNFDTELSRGIFTATTNYVYLTLDDSDSANPKLQFNAVIGDAAAKIDHAQLTVSKLGTFTPGSMTLTPKDLDTLSGLVNLGGGVIRCDCTLAVGQLSVGTHHLFDLELGPADDRSSVESGVLGALILEDSADSSPDKLSHFSLVDYRLRTELLSSVNATPLSP